MCCLYQLLNLVKFNCVCSWRNHSTRQDWRPLFPLTPHTPHTPHTPSRLITSHQTSSFIKHHQDSICITHRAPSDLFFIASLITNFKLYHTLLHFNKHVEIPVYFFQSTFALWLIEDLGERREAVEILKTPKQTRYPR